MELANQPPPQEIPLCQTSSLCPTYAAIGAVSLPAQAVVGRVALVSTCPFQPLQRPSASDRESASETREEAVVFSFLFQLGSARRRDSGPERREQPSGRSQ